MNRAGRFRSDMARNAARKRELLEQFPKALFVLWDVRINFAVSAFQIGVGDQSRPAMSRTCDVQDIEIVFFDQAIEVYIDEIQPWRCAPMAEQPGLDVFQLKWFSQQRIGVEINLSDGKKVRCPPISVNLT